MLGLGDIAKQETFVLVNYLPSIYRYDEHSEFDSDQHIVRLLAGYKTPNLILRWNTSMQSICRCRFQRCGTIIGTCNLPPIFS
jgi:hypothetical protein